MLKPKKQVRAPTRGSISNSSGPKFDDYAAIYEDELNTFVRRLLGGDNESYIEVKAEWLLLRSPQLLKKEIAANIKLLDYGCGTGTMLRVLRRLGFAGCLAGCDVSQQMLNQAIARYGKGDMPTLRLMEDMQAPFDDAEFDLVLVSSVLHHVPINQQDLMYSDIMRLLKPGGYVYVFEHNPYNPITQWVVRHTPIDYDAVLLRPGQIRSGLAKKNASNLETKYLMFGPPRLRYTRVVDRFLYWLPLSGQYCVVANK